LYYLPTGLGVGQNDRKGNKVSGDAIIWIKTGAMFQVQGATKII